MRKPTATWNDARGVWETSQELFCGHLEVFSQTWPVSGSMRNGEFYPQPPLAHVIFENVSSLLPTQVTEPTSRHGPASGLRTEISLLPTPHSERRSVRRERIRPDAATEHLFPTPTYLLPTAGGYQHLAKRQAGLHNVNLFDVIESELRPAIPLGTLGANHRHDNTHPIVGEAAHDQDWGKYEPAIRRQERIFGRAAPIPTAQGTKNNRPRLSPVFVEWMMGLPEGHITDLDIPRSAKLKALGNGVVPRQAAIALTQLCERAREQNMEHDLTGEAA